MQELGSIINSINPLEVVGDTKKKISNLVIDSRKAAQGSLFFAWVGTQTDGHQYIDAAIEQGAVAVVCERIPDEPKEAVTYLKVENSMAIVGAVASAWYQYPSRQMKVVGVTGTNGKTSICTLLFDLFKNLGFKTGLLSTVENKINDRIIPSTHTTPDPVSIQALLHEMAESGCDYVFMEVSSHAIHQNRIGGIEFTGGVFTNISRDHLDYHKTFKEYILAKKAFFDQLSKNAFALVNVDDKNGRVMVQNCAASIQEFSLERVAAFRGKVIANTLDGLEMQINGMDFHSPMVGVYNGSNLLATYATAKLLEQEATEVLTVLSGLKGAKGRFEVYKGADGTKAVVDYAHTPDALENVLQAIIDANASNAKVWTVIGCGGDRDAGKRPQMAKIAADYSGQVILTSDNPRSEDPEDIIKDMLKGVQADQVNRVLAITDRAMAIKTAFQFSAAGDIILIAGKGHENYQEIKGKRIHFDDAEEIEKHLKNNH